MCTQVFQSGVLCLSPVELVDVLDVSKQSTHLLRTNQQIRLIDDVSQVILMEETEN